MAALPLGGRGGVCSGGPRGGEGVGPAAVHQQQPHEEAAGPANATHLAGHMHPKDKGPRPLFAKKKPTKFGWSLTAVDRRAAAVGGYPTAFEQLFWGGVFAQLAHSTGTAPIILLIIQVTTLKTTHLRNHAQSIYCSSHSMTSFQSSELTELPVVENSQLFAQRAHSARYAPWAIPRGSSAQVKPTQRRGVVKKRSGFGWRGEGAL